MLAVGIFGVSVADVNNDELLKPVSLDSDSVVDYTADSMEYNNLTGELVLLGNARLWVPSEGITITADRITYLEQDKTLVAVGHVLIKNQDQLSFAEHFTLDIPHQQAELKQVETLSPRAFLVGEYAKINDTERYTSIYYRNGTLDFGKPVRVSEQSSRIGSAGSFRLNELIQADPEKLAYSVEPSFQLQAREVRYYPDRVQNNIFLSRPVLRFKKIPLEIPFPSWFVTAGRSNEQMLTPIIGNSPETGSGDFNLGPKFSFVLGDPEDERTLHFGPFMQLISNTGAGAMVGYTDKRADVLLAYGSSKNRGLAEVTYKISPHNNFVYGWNSYLGGGITKQFFQTNDFRSFRTPLIGDFLEGGQIMVQNDVSVVQDSDTLRNQENNRISTLQNNSLNDGFSADKWGGRYQNTVSFTTKPILEFGRNDYSIGFRFSGSSIFRYYVVQNSTKINYLGVLIPNVRIHLNKYSDLEMGYVAQAVSGSSPFGFDQIIAGASSAYFNAELNLTSWLSLSNYSSYSFSNSSFIAQQLGLVLGPDDFKFMVSYDPIYRRFNIGFNILFVDPVRYYHLNYTQKKLRR